MRPYVSLCVFLGAFAFLCVFVGSYRFLCLAMDSKGSLLVPSGP